MFSSCALDPSSNYKLALFGPPGGLNPIIYDLASHQWKGQLCDEQGDVLDVEWYDRGPVTAGSNGSISIWSHSGSIRFKMTDAHDAAVVGIDLHPMGGMLASAAANGEWALHDLVTEKTVAKFKDDAGMFPLHTGNGVNNVEFRCSDLHPDGHVYLIGCEDGTIRVYDLLTGTLNGTLGPSAGPILSLHVSSNGYWLAETNTVDSIVRIWDLRKATAVAFELQGSSVGGKVRWDHGGQYVALGGRNGVDVWAYQKKAKSFEKITKEPMESAGVKCLEWGLDGKMIVCGGLNDGTICILGVGT